VPGRSRGKPAGDTRDSSRSDNRRPRRARRGKVGADRGARRSCDVGRRVVFVIGQASQPEWRVRAATRAPWRDGAEPAGGGVVTRSHRGHAHPRRAGRRQKPGHGHAATSQSQRGIAPLLIGLGFRAMPVPKAGVSGPPSFSKGHWAAFRVRQVPLGPPYSTNRAAFPGTAGRNKADPQAIPRYWLMTIRAGELKVRPGPGRGSSLDVSSPLTACVPQQRRGRPRREWCRGRPRLAAELTPPSSAAPLQGR